MISEKDFDMKELKSTTLERIKLAMSASTRMEGIRLGDVKAFAEIDYLTDSLVTGITGYALGHKVHEKTEKTWAVPKTWRDAWKLKHAHKLPVIIQNRLSPIEFIYLEKSVSHTHMCPHIENENRSTHISFMTFNDTGENMHKMGEIQNRIKEIKKQLMYYHPMYPDQQQYMTDEGKKLLKEMDELNNTLKENNIFEDVNI